MYYYGKYDFDCDYANSTHNSWGMDTDNKIEQLCSSVYLREDEDEDA